MEKNFHKALSFTIKYFPEHTCTVNSRSFSSGGCEWFVMGNFCDKYLSVYLSANKPESLGLNWKRRASFYFFFKNQSGKEICRTPESGDVLFCDETPNWGFAKVFSLKELLEDEFLVKEKFCLDVYMKVVEVVDGIHMSLYGELLKLLKFFTNKLLRWEKETVNVNGFQVLSSQATSVRQIFLEHPDIATGFKPKNQVVKTEYMNVLLKLFETVKKPLKSVSEIELNKAQRDLCELIEVGFKLEWFKTKLEEIAFTEGFKIQQLEEQVKKLEIELDKEKIKSSSVAAKVLSLEQKLSDLKVEKDQKKGNSENTDKLLSWEDDVYF